MVLEGDRSMHYNFEQLSFCILVVSFIVNFSGSLLLFFWGFSFASYFHNFRLLVCLLKVP